MSKSVRSTTGFVLGLATLFVVFLVIRPKPIPLSDLEFTQMAFAALMQGDSRAESLVDFKKLHVNGMKYGNSEDYVALQNEKEKADFRAAMVAEFGHSIRNSGLQVETLKSWKVRQVDPITMLIYANATNGHVLDITLSKQKGERKISEVGISLP